MAFLISIIPPQQHEICENFIEFLPAAEKLWYQSVTGKTSMSPIMMELWSCDRNDGNSSCHLSFIFGLNMPAQRDGWQQWEGWWWRVDGEIGWWQRAERAEPQPDPPWPVRGPTLIQQLSVGPPGQTRALCHRHPALVTQPRRIGIPFMPPPPMMNPTMPRRCCTKKPTTSFVSFTATGTTAIEFRCFGESKSTDHGWASTTEGRSGTKSCW